MSGNVIKLSPSRRFLVTQAVLNASEKHFHFCIKKFGRGDVLQKILDGDDTVRAGFYLEVCEEFDALSRTYVVPPPDHGFTDEDFAGFEAALTEGRAFL